MYTIVFMQLDAHSITQSLDHHKKYLLVHRITFELFEHQVVLQGKSVSHRFEGLLHAKQNGPQSAVVMSQVVLFVILELKARIYRDLEMLL